jgi:DNA-binding LacI/PurR family transcriptional regulator
MRLAIVLRTNRNDLPEGNRFYVPVSSAIAQSCTNAGAEIVYSTVVVDDQYSMVELPRELTDGSCDGALFVGMQLDQAAAERIRATVCPVVLVDGYSADDAFDSVVTDNVTGARAAVEHLIAAGHSEIALIGTEPDAYPSILGRRIGYTQALEAHGLPIHYFETGYNLVDTAALVGVDYLRRNPEVTAVFAANDIVAVTFMRAARDAGYRIPTDLSLVGFDDVDLATLVIPALTTMAIDKALLGRAAFALLAHRLEVSAASPTTAVIMPRLVERESVVPPRPSRR